MTSKTAVCGSLLSLGLMLMGALPAAAHHSAAAYYDIDKTVTITGTLARVDWRNPHVFFYVTVKNSEGRVTTWTLESQSAVGLEQLGLSKRAVTPGDPMTVHLMPALHSPNRGRIRDFTYHGRTFVDFGRSGPQQ